uniref:Uncharacterized protein n=1 Tax=Anguilla anguilla TaxID=7936 RepID=A0A0E9VLU4_ANGAN
MSAVAEFLNGAHPPSRLPRPAGYPQTLVLAIPPTVHLFSWLKPICTSRKVHRVDFNLSLAQLKS